MRCLLRSVRHVAEVARGLAATRLAIEATSAAQLRAPLPRACGQKGELSCGEREPAV